MAEKKITKKEYFAMVAEIVNGSNAENKAELMEFIQKQVEVLDKKAEGDELRAKVQSVLTEELQTIDEIVDAIGEEDVTRNKVVARLTQLVAAEVAVKDKVESGSKKVMGYKLKAEVDAAEDAEVTEEVAE